MPIKTVLAPCLWAYLQTRTKPPSVARCPRFFCPQELLRRACLRRPLRSITQRTPQGPSPRSYDNDFTVGDCVIARMAHEWSGC